MILRARAKPIEEIPEEALCCDKVRRSWVEGFIVEVISGVPAIATCLDCGTERPGVALAGKRKGKTIDPRAWDIEESPEVAAYEETKK